MLADETLEPAHPLVQELIRTMDTWRFRFRSSAAEVGRSVAMEVLYNASSLWWECASSYGYPSSRSGLPFREWVADKLEAWCEDSAQKPLWAEIEDGISRAWEEQVIGPLHELSAVEDSQASAA